MVEFWVEDGKHPEILLRFNADPGKLRLDAAPVLRALEKWLEPDRLEQLRKRALAGENEGGEARLMLSFEDLRAEGLAVEYDDALLRVDIKVPVSLRRTQARSLSGYGAGTAYVDELTPAFVSGFLNTAASKNFALGTTSPANTLAPSTTSLAFDGALNVHSLDIEGSASYSELNTSAWQRGDVRAIQDLQPLMLRLTAGDLSLSLTGYANYVPMGGASVTTNFGTRPDLVVTALSHHEIELQFPSTVNVYRNGALLQSLKLNPGKYDLKDLPVLAGANNFVLEVIDPSGRKTVVDLSQYYNGGFLAPGLHQVAYAVGLPWTQNGFGRSYDSTNTTYVLSHRVGLTTELTAGAFYERNATQSLAGGDFLVPGLWGVFQTQFALSQSLLSDVPAFGTGVRVQYSNSQLLDGEVKGTRTFNLVLENRSPHFFQLGDSDYNPAFAWDFTGSVTQPLSAALTVNLNVSYDLVRILAPDGRDDSYRVTVGCAKNFDRGLSGSFNLGYNNAPGLAEISGSVFFNWTFPEKQQSLQASYDSGADRTTLAWSKNTNPSVGSTQAKLELDRDPTQRSLSLQADYFANRAQLGLQEDVVQDSLSGITTPETTLTASTALVFAGANVALSRRVSDGFILVSPGRMFRDQTIEIDPLGDGTYLASSDWMGSGVLGNLSSYRDNEIALGESQMKSGFGLPSAHYRARPTYKSGVVLSFDSELNVILRGALVGVEGAPLNRVAGELVPLDGDAETRKIVTFFTNRAGRFQIESLKPGRYEFHFYDEKWQNLPYVIPEDADGLTDVGKLTVHRAMGATAQTGGTGTP
jgi:outer membrane usher protein